jgi:hypothetical protein
VAASRTSGATQQNAACRASLIVVILHRAQIRLAALPIRRSQSGPTWSNVVGRCPRSSRAEPCCTSRGRFGSCQAIIANSDTSRASRLNRHPVNFEDEYAGRFGVGVELALKPLGFLYGAGARAEAHVFAVRKSAAGMRR